MPVNRLRQQWIWHAWKCLLAVVCLNMQGCIFDASACENEVLSHHPSPTGQYTASIFQRNCGATTPFSTQVSVLAGDEQLANLPGNAFIADSVHGAAPSSAGGSPEVTVQWLSATSLLIQHHPEARVFHSPETVGNVQLSFQPLETTSQP